MELSPLPIGQMYISNLRVAGYSKFRIHLNVKSIFHYQTAKNCLPLSHTKDDRLNAMKPT